MYAHACVCVHMCTHVCVPVSIHAQQIYVDTSFHPFPFQVGQEIEVRPGIVSKTADSKIQCTPIRSKITSLFAENNSLQFAVPGGLIGEMAGLFGRGGRGDLPQSTLPLV